MKYALIVGAGVVVFWGYVVVVTAHAVGGWGEYAHALRLEFTTEGGWLLTFPLFMVVALALLFAWVTFRETR